jgi:iron only hydrogenase large subunit-like protein
MFEAKGIAPANVEGETEMDDATGAGRGYGVAGGVASAIEACIREKYPDVDVNIEHAESLSECKKILMLAKAGKKKGCLIEGMACPGGCIAGAGTNIALPQAQKNVASFQKEAKQAVPDM